MSIEEISHAYEKMIDDALIERVEVILGRVPSNQEIAAHCYRINYPDGRREYTWSGQTILKVDALFGARWQ